MASKASASSPRQDFAPFPDESSPPKDIDDANDIFDPFGLGTSFEDLSTASPHPPPKVTRLTKTPDSTGRGTSQTAEKDGARPKQATSPASAVVESRKTQSPSKTKLPPKLLVRFTYHEEISSIAKLGPQQEGTSEVSIDGKLHAQVQSSDAKQNAPFLLIATSVQGGNLEFLPNDEFVTSPASPTEDLPSMSRHIVQIPKKEIGNALVGTYTLSEEVQHMPILVERKVTMFGKSCRVAVQVRSKLTNLGPVTDFTIAVAVPESVDGDTVKLLRGVGEWDELKRTIKWKVGELPKGESFMVSAQCQLWSAVAKEEQHTIRFPVLLRCSSAFDQISTADFRAKEAQGFPATVVSSKQHSFRLLHRLT